LNTVLVVDDARSPGGVVRRFYESGFPAIGCGDGRQALEYVAADVIRGGFVAVRNRLVYPRHEDERPKPDAGCFVNSSTTLHRSERLENGEERVSRNFLKFAFISVCLLATCTDRVRGADATSRKNSLDTVGMDKTVNPGDDFYGFANGGWMKATAIPADRAGFGLFSILDEEVSKRTAGLIQDAGKSKEGSGSDAGKIGAFYEAYMDENAIEKRGLTPLKGELDEIGAIADRTTLARVLGGQLRADVDALNNTNFHTDRLFGVWVSPDFSNPDRNVAYLLQGGLGLPDRDNYRNTGAKDVELQAKYRAHIIAVLKLANVPDADAKGARIYDLERRIADAHVSRTDSEDVLKANNPWRLQDFPTRAPGLEWGSYFEAAGLAGQPMIMVWQPSGVSGIAALVGSQPVDVWKEYLTFHVIDRASRLLPQAFADERFKFYGTALTGALKQRDRWKLAVSATGAALGDAVGKLYVQRYFSPEAKAQAQAMVKNIVAAFGRRIDSLDWMSPATRAKAKAKLDTLYVGIGYPEHWQDYSALKVERDDALGNAQRSELVRYRASLAKLGKPVDKSEWAMTPQTVNAVNLPLQNALNFPAAILNPPFFDVAADPVENYGAIGTVIGHEISHSFDDQGSQFDAAGRLLNWWTPEDFAHFGSSADRLAAEFDAYEPLPGLHVNGKLTLSENIADVAGVSASFDAYRSAYGNKAAPDLGGFTGDQRFFLAFAQAWRGKQRPEALRNLLMTDGHAPGEFRADTVRNIDAWYKAFDIQPGRKLYLKPEARVRVW
jgi:putative endopeptidase